jgi:hypothetical protein
MKIIGKNKSFYFVIIIIFILFALLLFLGGINIYEGYSSLSSSTNNSTEPININSKVFYGPDGSSATIITENTSISSIIIKNSNTNTTTIFIPVKIEKTNEQTITITDGTNTYTFTSTTYQSSNGNTATIKKDSNNNILIVVKNKKTGTTTIYKNTPSTSNTNSTNSTNSTNTTNSTNSTNTTNTTNSTNSTNSTITSKIFYGPNNSQATIITDDNNHIDSIIITNPNTGSIVYIPLNIQKTNEQSINITDGTNTYTFTSTTYQASNGNTATIKKDSNNNILISVKNKTDGSITIFTNVSKNNQYSNNTYNNNNYEDYSSSSSSSSSSSNSTPYPTPTVINTSSNSSPVVTNYDSSSYYNSKQGFNGGIPASQIPLGSEDLYILKSQIVPPVCPVCPPPIIKNCDKESKCPPCPAPQRCPEPDFICKKELNYQNNNIPKLIPQPVLNDFSSFGM